LPEINKAANAAAKKYVEISDRSSVTAFMLWAICKF
jgi:hypothetical protein